MSGLSDRGIVLTLGACIVAFGVGMSLRQSFGIWLGTGSAAVLSMAVIAASDPSARTRLFRGWSARACLAGLAVGMGMSIATWVLYPLSAQLIPGIEREVTELYTLLREPPGPVRALPVLALVVATEELVWRGLALDLFIRRLRPGQAVLAAAALSILPQLALQSLLLVAVGFSCALVWGWLRVKYVGLAAPLIAHLLWDLLVFVLFPVV